MDRSFDRCNVVGRYRSLKATQSGHCKAMFSGDLRDFLYFVDIEISTEAKTFVTLIQSHTIVSAIQA